MLKFTNTWIIGSLVYFAQGKINTLLQRKIEAQLQVKATEEFIELLRGSSTFTDA